MSRHGLRALPSPVVPERCGAAPPRSVNPVVLALEVALRDIEGRRSRGKVHGPPTSRRPAA
jgi:hypothetical protein